MIQFTTFIFTVLCIIVFLLKSLVIIDKDEQAVVERFGKFSRILGKGIHFIIPFVESLRGIERKCSLNSLINKNKVKLSTQKLIFPNDDRIFFAPNHEQLKVRGEIYYTITDSYKAVYEIDYILDSVNQLVASVIQKRLIEKDKDLNAVNEIKNISDNIIGVCNDYSNNWGINIDKIKINQIIDNKGIRHNFEN